MKRHSAVFFDRDGVLNPEVGYTADPNDAKLFADVAPALARLQSAGQFIFVFSNQSGIGRGYYTTTEVQRFNQALCDQLKVNGVVLRSSQFYFCPHLPTEMCPCRKPNPGLLIRAAQEHDIDLSRSFSVGDREIDIQAGKAAGTATILLVRAGVVPVTSADHVVSTLFAAAEWILLKCASYTRAGRSD